MKTCTNPTCNASNIPDDAMFCPVCGEALVEVTNPWKENYDAFMKEREELLIKKKQLSLFETARQKMFSTLKQDGNYEAAMQENREIIKANREGKVHPTFKVVFALLCIGAIIFLIGAILGKNIIMGIGGIVAGMGLMLMIGALAAYTEKELVENQYITNFLRPFIKSHQEDYMATGYRYSLLESEIIEPEKISKEISQKIEEIAKQIINIEYQMQLMQQMK